MYTTSVPPISVRLTNNILSLVSDAIVELFPKECKELYYASPLRKRHSKNNRSGIARGKLVDKNRNMLQFLRKCKLLQPKNPHSDDDDNNENGDESDVGMFSLLPMVAVTKHTHTHNHYVLV